MVIRPYKRINSIDEDDDQGSSWEFELAGGETGQRPTFHYLAEDDNEEQASGGLHPTKRRWGPVDMEESQRCGRLGSSGDGDAGEHVSRNIQRGDGKILEREGLQRTRREHTKNYGQQVMSVRTPEGVVRKRTWQVSDVRKALCIGISHHPSWKPVHQED